MQSAYCVPSNNKSKTKKKGLLKVFLIVLLVLASVYGFLSVYTESMVIRSIKDILLLFLVVYSLMDFIIIRDQNKLSTKHLILFLLTLLMIIGIFGVFSGKEDFLTYIYGLKITVLPIGTIFIGYIIKKHNVNIDKTILFSYVLMVVTWIIEQKLGIDKLLSLGFQYGVNVKNFNSQLRLPSTIGTPDGYAFYLCICGLFLETSDLFKNRNIFRMLVKISTMIFLVLSTIRSAMVLWMICQLFLLLINLKNYSINKKLIVLSLGSFLVALVPIIWIFFISNSSLMASNSFQDRLSHWGNFTHSVLTTEGIVGTGLGSVGSASRRASDLGSVTLNYGVDNQFLAFYEQLGLVGCLIILIMFFSILKTVIKNSNKYCKVSLIITPLIIGVLISSFFTNTLEIYPFNILFWIMIGFSLCDNYSFELKER